MSVDVAAARWKHQVNSSVALHFSFDFDESTAFSGSITNRRLAELGMFSVRCRRHVVFREDRDLEANDAAYFLLSLQLSGQKRISQGGTTSVIRSGEFTVYDSERPLVFEVDDDYRSVNVKFRKNAIGSHDSDRFAGLVAQPFAADQGIANVVWSTIRSLDAAGDRLGSEGILIAGNVIDMTATMLRSQIGSADVGRDGARDLRLRAVRAFIDEHLADPGLHVDRIAGANFMSVRSLHALFSATGFSVAAWIRHRRIEACKRDLADGAQSTVPAVSIGLRWGFASASHFGQVFKQATGLTPSEYRDFTRG